MATTKRERQKAARQQRLARMQRDAKRRKFIRRGVIVVIAGAVIVVSAAYLFAGSTTTATTTTTSSVTTTTLAPIVWSPVKDPSPAGTWGKAPTVIVPSGSPPTTPERNELIVGNGAQALNGDTLTVQYVLATYSSRKVIQSSWTSKAFSFTLGEGQVITGWDEGLVGMRQGTRVELILPPSLGYGDASPGGGISKNDTLVFVVDVLKVS